MKACGLRVTIPRIKGSSDFAVKGEIYSLARIENIEEKRNMKIGEYSMEIYIFSIYGDAESFIDVRKVRLRQDYRWLNSLN